MVHLSDVLRLFEQYGRKLKPKKCQLLQNSEVFLGRLVSRKGWKFLMGRLLELVPLCKRDVLSFIGVLNFHRDHIPKYALVAKPLYDIICREASETPCTYVKITPAHLRPVCRDDSWIVFWYSEYF